MSLINNMYFQTNKNKKEVLKNRLETFYPLGVLSNTKNIAKNRSIIQVQFSISQQYENKIDELVQTLIYKQNPLLCSIKKSSENPTELNLSFVQKGWVIAIDFPKSKFDSSQIRQFYKKLQKYGGKIYLAKDSTLTEKEFKSQYENFGKWSKIVKTIDPNNLFQSELSYRLGLKKW